MELLLRAHMFLSACQIRLETDFIFIFTSILNNRCKTAIHAGVKINGGVVYHHHHHCIIIASLMNLLHLLILWFFHVSVADSLFPHSSPSAHRLPSDAFFHPSTVRLSSVHAFIGSESSSAIHPSRKSPISLLQWTSCLFPGSDSMSYFLPQPCFLSFYSHFSRCSVILQDWSFHSPQCLFSLLSLKKEIILPNLTFVPSLIYFPPHPPESMQPVFLIFHPSFSLVVFSFHSIVSSFYPCFHLWNISLYIPSLLKLKIPFSSFFGTSSSHSSSLHAFPFPPKSNMPPSVHSKVNPLLKKYFWIKSLSRF